MTKLNKDKWLAFSKDEQILHIYSELLRAKAALERGSEGALKESLETTLCLVDLTVNDPKWQKSALREMLFLRDIISYFYLNKTKKVKELVSAMKALLMFSPAACQVRV